MLATRHLPLATSSMDRDLESIQRVRQLVESAAEAQKALEHFSQEQTNAIVAACAEAARQNAEPLARLAVEETTYGVVADKIEKNLFAARDVFEAIRGIKTVGVIREDAKNHVVEIAVPAGVVAAIIPTTNPTSTAIFKALISLKARNAIVMSPHPNAIKCIAETARLMYEAALRAGAPEGSIGCMSLVTNEATNELMRHPKTAIILATGGTGLVRAAYSSGKPALGVGPGNVPSYVHSSANVPKAVADILRGKCFDNGTLCSSEQHIVVDSAVAAQVRAEAERQGGLFLTPEQAAAVARVLILPNFRVNAKMVGQSAEKIAREAGFAIPKGTRALIAPLEGIGREHPLSAEKLSPVLSFYVVKDSREALDVCMRFLRLGGMGHTMSIQSIDNNLIREFALKLPAFRMIANSPASHGSVGYSTNLFPSMSLGCGTPGNNITSDNISPMHLLNIKRLAYETKPVNAELSGKSASVVRAVSPAAAPAPISAAPSATHPASAVISGGVTQEHINELVERFLSGRGKASGNPAESHVNPGQPSETCGAASPAPSPAASQQKPVDFVSEDDVRQAVKRGEKIVVGPRTIITPSAHDLGDPIEIFIRTQS
ncbi:MAG TPA: aldehyde dehydrogenase family protein [Terriglobia bacterium]|nr:aldehyde dehydrogenase family protein [Terriglobia bacterium]